MFHLPVRFLILHSIGDHIFGLLPLLASRLNGTGGTVEGLEDPRATLTSEEDVRLHHLGSDPQLTSFSTACRDLWADGHSGLHS